MIITPTITIPLLYEKAISIFWSLAKMSQPSKIVDTVADRHLFMKSVQ